MGERTLEELRKEINGKQVVYADAEMNVRFDALLICPPDGEQVSVKPYGYSPQEILQRYHDAGENWVELGAVSAKEFCFLSARAREKNREALEKLADLKDGAIVQLSTLTDDDPVSRILGGQPSCPYG